MKHTKIRKYKDGTFGLLVLDENRNYKQIGRAAKSIINNKRAEVRGDSIDVQAELHKKTFIDVYEEFCKSKEDEAAHAYSGVRQSSIKTYRSFLRKYIKSYFPSHVLIKDITPKIHVVPFFLKLREEGASWITANNVVKTFSTCMRFAVEHQYIKHIGGFAVWQARKDPATRSSPSEMAHKKTKMISRQECENLFFFLRPKKNDRDVTNWQKFALVSTLIFTGMRLSEVRALRWDRLYLDLETAKIKVDHSVVGSGDQIKKQVKAEGSDRMIIVHPMLKTVLKAWKAILTRHYTGRKMPLVFPTLRNTGLIVPLAERTITNWLKLAFVDLGYATVKVHKNKEGQGMNYVQLLTCKFGHAVTKTFRHFASTALIDNQAAYPVLNDNFITGQIGHQDIRTTRSIYGNHKNYDTSTDLEAKQREAIEQAIPIGSSKSDVIEDARKKIEELDKEEEYLDILKPLN